MQLILRMFIQQHCKNALLVEIMFDVIWEVNFQGRALDGEQRERVPDIDSFRKALFQQHWAACSLFFLIFICLCQLVHSWRVCVLFIVRLVCMQAVAL